MPTGPTDPTGPVPGWQIGVDGAPPVEARLVYETEEPVEVTDLAFDPMHADRLWVMMRPMAPEGPLICEPGATSGCDYMGSYTATIDRPGASDAEVVVVVDPNAWHFMRRTLSLAIGTDTGFWASCGDFWTGNFTSTPIQFMGPSLWSSDLSLHGVEPPGGNGSHYDMLHGTPLCTGIAWEVDNVYWAINGVVGGLDRVDFAEDHGPGQSDHSDGTYARFVEGELSRVADVPSHLQVDGSWVYVADTGNQRVVRLDITSGEVAGQSSTPDPVPIAIMEDATLEAIITTGLVQPSGLALVDDVLFVSDFTNATIGAYTLDGIELGTLDLGDVASAVTGLAVGPKGRLYFADMHGQAVYRLEPVD
ncbi:MAG: hypothetical protein AAF211_14415 [Myxococcota bacterium]